jgi:molybdate transport system substrate-binding protein
LRKNVIRLLAVVLATLAGLAGGATDAAELKVLSAGSMRAVLQELGPAFEKSSGHKLSIEYATAGKIEEKVAADDTIDVAILSKPRADKLVRVAKLVGGTATTLASVPIGLAVKKGAPKPDISSVDAFKKALLNAKSVAYLDPASGATSGIYLAQALEKLGIAAELKPKLRLVSATAGQDSPRVGDAVLRGEAEIGMQAISELMEVQGIDIVGPLPAEVQKITVFSAGVSTTSKEPDAAKALIKFLSSAQAAPVLVKSGLDPIPAGGKS